MRTINLTQNKVALVDDADYPELAKYKWMVLNERYTYYARRNKVEKDGRRHTVLMHREIMNASLDQELDHKNQKGFDNRRSNLRFCTNQQNRANLLSRHGISQYKGVSWDKRNGKWVAGIRYNYKRIHLGCFDDEREAALAYDRAALRLFGDFAFPNFPYPVGLAT